MSEGNKSAKTKSKPKTKKCKHCKSDMPYNAKVCPTCRRRQGRFLKWVIIILAVLVVLGVIGSLSGGDDNETSKKPKNPTSSDVESTQDTAGENINEAQQEENQAEEPIGEPVEESAESGTEFDYEDMHVRYTGHELGQNMAGEKTLIVYFDFTNNSSENKSFAYSFSAKAFQNGVELDSSLLFSNDTCKNRDNEIQPGTTVPIGVDFVLGEDMSDVSLQIEPWISFTNETLLNIPLALQ